MKDTNDMQEEHKQGVRPLPKSPEASLAETYGPGRGNSLHRALSGEGLGLG